MEQFKRNYRITIFMIKEVKREEETTTKEEDIMKEKVSLRT